MGFANRGFSNPFQSIDDIAEDVIMTEASHDAITVKYPAIVISTDDTPDTTGWADPTVLLIYEA